MRKFFKGFRCRSPSLVIREFETFSDLSAVMPVLSSDIKKHKIDVLTKQDKFVFDLMTGQGEEVKTNRDNILHVIFSFFIFMLNYVMIIRALNCQ